MEEIVRLVSLARSDRFTITVLCEQFGISRQTTYKHLERTIAKILRRHGLSGRPAGLRSAESCRARCHGSVAEP